MPYQQLELEREVRSLRRTRRWLWLLGLLFGGLFCALNPPYQGHDEAAHMHRVWELSTGTLYSLSDGGGTYTLYPLAGQELINRFRHLRAADDRHFDVRLLAEGWDAPWDERERVRMRADASSYAPISYVPHVPVEYLARTLALPAPYHLYLGRLAGLCCYLALVWIALGWLGHYRWIGFALALMPMSLWQASSISADCMTNALSLMLLAWAVHSSLYERARFGLRDGWITLLLLTGVGTSKFIYAPIGLLMCAVPTTRFASRKHKWAALLAIATVAALPALLFALRAVPMDDPSPSASTNMSVQLHRLLFEPWRFVGASLNTLYRQGWQLLQMTIGHFGRKSARILYVPRLVVILYVLMLALLVTSSRIPDERRLSRTMRFVSYGVALLSIVLSFVALYLAHTRPEQDHVSGLQGRYFIPALYVALVALASRFAAPRAWRIVQRLDGLVIGVVFVSLASAVGTLLRVFYI